MDFRKAEYWEAVRKLARKSGFCLFPGEEFRLHGSLLVAGGLAESLYEQEFAKDDAAALARRLDARTPIQARDEVELIGLCVARRDPAGVRSLLATKPAQTEERTAILALKPVLQGCMQAGTQARLSRHALRALFALGLYRLTRHANAVALSTPATVSANA